MKAKERRAAVRHRKFLTQARMRSIRWAIAMSNGRARRDGLIPKGAHIYLLSCPCQCVAADVR